MTGTDPQAFFARFDAESRLGAAEADNVRLVRASFEAATRGDMSAFADMLADDIEFELYGPADIAFRDFRGAKGRAAVAEQVRRNFDAISIQQIALLSLVAQGDQVSVFGNDQSRLKATGQNYTAHWAYLFTVRGGRISHIHEIFVANPEGASYE